MSADHTYQASYGKLQVPFYRAYGQPMRGLTPIPESPFTGRENTLFAAEIDVEVFGDNFLPAYTAGDKSSIVATDSMKNFVFQQALAYDGTTLEGFLALLGQRFLATYPQIERLRLTGRELPFAPAPVPAAPASRDFVPSGVLFQRTHDDYALAVLNMTRDGQDAIITGHRCGRVGMQLLKVTGSAFTRFVRDQYTTLPERGDRPLFIALDVFWRYADTANLLAPDLARYVAAEQVRDLVRVVFHEFVSESIQHLTHEMGTRLLARFPQLAEVAFEGQNRTPDPMAVSADDEKIKVYSSAFPAFGLIKLTMARNG
jgi:urate oxidase